MSAYSGVEDAQTTGDAPLVVSFAACHQGQPRPGVQHAWVAMAAARGIAGAGSFVDLRDDRKFNDPIGGSTLLARNIGLALRQLARRHALPLSSLCFGGDHTISIGTVMATRQMNPATRLVWIDAHPDINTPDESLSGNCHGMPVAHLLGWVDGFEMHRPLQCHEVCYIGVRSVDAAEAVRLDRLRAEGGLVFTADHVRSVGIGACLRELHERWGGGGDDGGDGTFDFPIHISLDIDSIDAAWAPATGTPVPGGNGLTPDQVCAALRFCNQTAAAGQTHLDVVEVNPYLSSARGAATTLRTARHVLGHWLDTHRVLNPNTTKAAAAAPSPQQLNQSARRLSTAAAAASAVKYTGGGVRRSAYPFIGATAAAAATCIVLVMTGMERRGYEKHGKLM